MPSRSQAGSTSRSASRASRLYSFCRAQNGVSPSARAVASASASCWALKFDAPIARTVPSRTSSSSAASVSAIGVRPSGSWYQ